MFIAMNQFRVIPAKASEFEQAWRERESFLSSVPGFESFALLRGGPAEEGAQLYASHTVWRSQKDFLDWTQSEAFRKAHAQGHKTSGLVLGPPKLMTWESVDL